MLALIHDGAVVELRDMAGFMTYADTGASVEFMFFDWRADSSNQIFSWIDTSSTRTGQPEVTSKSSGTSWTASGQLSEYSPGVNVAFANSYRVTNDVINIAANGTAETEDTSPTSIANLAAANFAFGSASGFTGFNGIISEFRAWGADIGDTGIAEATT